VIFYFPSGSKYFLIKNNAAFGLLAPAFHLEEHGARFCGKISLNQTKQLF
jgi:hypothetical protein